MSDSRERTLASLDAFLESQRQLLARTQSDLHKLASLREHALADPQEFINNVEEELDDSAFKLSEYEVTERPEDIDWDLFTSLDPSPFDNIPLPGPLPISKATIQRSPPSELQTFVRDASKEILADFRPFVPKDVDDNQDTDTDAADEKRLAELVRTGKANKCQNSGKVGVDASHIPRRRVGSGLRLKHAQDSLVSDPKGKSRVGEQNDDQDDVPPLSPQVRQRPQRIRRPTVKADQMYQLSPSTKASPIPPMSPPSLIDNPDATLGSEIPDVLERLHSDPSSIGDSNHDPPPDPSKTKRQDASKPRRRKAPSETFNLPWSLSEQHLLEKLLTEIPAGEKQRWAKISKAMSGKRTPRQVASRVQKYYEKLKKFGVEPG